MPSKGSITKTIRVNEEDKEYIERRIEEEGLTWSGVIHRLIEEKEPVRVIQEECISRKEYDELQRKYKEALKKPSEQQIMKEETWRELRGMIRLMGYSEPRFFDLICELLNEGKIYQEGMVLKTLGEIDTREFEEICHRVNVEPEDMLKKFIKGMSR